MFSSNLIYYKSYFWLEKYYFKIFKTSPSMIMDTSLIICLFHCFSFKITKRFPPPNKRRVVAIEAHFKNFRSDQTPNNSRRDQTPTEVTRHLQRWQDTRHFQRWHDTRHLQRSPDTSRGNQTHYTYRGDQTPDTSIGDKTPPEVTLHQSPPEVTWHQKPPDVISHQVGFYGDTQTFHAFRWTA